jgi:hypothetical protein
MPGGDAGRRRAIFIANIFARRAAFGLAAQYFS